MRYLLINLFINNLITLIASKVGSGIQLIVTSALLSFKRVSDPWFKQPYKLLIYDPRNIPFSHFSKKPLSPCVFITLLLDINSAFWFTLSTFWISNLAFKLIVGNLLTPSSFGNFIVFLKVISLVSINSNVSGFSSNPTVNLRKVLIYSFNLPEKYFGPLGLSATNLYSG